MSKEDDERRLVERLMAKTAREWKEPRPVTLEGPGPFELPLCGMKVSSQTLPPGKFVLVLETAKEEQTLRIPISVQAVPNLVAIALGLQAMTKQSDEKPN